MFKKECLFFNLNVNFQEILHSFCTNIIFSRKTKHTSKIFLGIGFHGFIFPQCTFHCRGSPPSAAAIAFHISFCNGTSGIFVFSCATSWLEKTWASVSVWLPASSAVCWRRWISETVPEILCRPHKNLPSPIPLARLFHVWASNLKLCNYYYCFFLVACFSAIFAL